MARSAVRVLQTSCAAPPPTTGSIHLEPSLDFTESSVLTIVDQMVMAVAGLLKLPHAAAHQVRPSNGIHSWRNTCARPDDMQDRNAPGDSTGLTHHAP